MSSWSPASVVCKYGGRIVCYTNINIRAESLFAPNTHPMGAVQMQSVLVQLLCVLDEQQFRLFGVKTTATAMCGTEQLHDVGTPLVDALGQIVRDGEVVVAADVRWGHRMRLCILNLWMKQNNKLVGNLKSSYMHFVRLCLRSCRLRPAAPDRPAG